MSDQVHYLSIDEASDGQRLDNFLFKQLKGVPKGHVYRLLRTGQVRVNKKRAKPATRLQLNDQVRVPPVRVAERPNVPDPETLAKSVQSSRWRLSDCIIAEDDRLIVMNKPAGVAVHGGSGIEAGVIERLRAERPDAPYLELVHRLDRATSGLLLIAKRRSTLRALHELLRNSKMQKHYLALAAGHWQQAGWVNFKLQKTDQANGEQAVQVSQQGKESRSHFRPLQHYGDATLVNVKIATGRMHQIRVHAAAEAHPLLGDDKYGQRDLNRQWRKRGLKRLFLHAHKLSFNDPDTGKERVYQAPLPDDLQRLLDNLQA